MPELALSGNLSLEEIQDQEDAYEERNLTQGQNEDILAQFDQLLRKTVEEQLNGEIDIDARAHQEQEPDSVLEPISDDDLLGLINNELSHAIGENDGTNSERAKALDYYNGKPRGDEKTGRSTIQSLDVADMTEALLAQMLPAFARNMVVEFGATSPEDEVSAQQESEYVDYVVMEENNGWTTLYKLFKEGLLLRNCVARIDVIEDNEVAVERHQNVPSLVIAQLMRPKNDPQEEVELTKIFPGEGPVEGPAELSKIAYYDIEIKRKWKIKHINIKPLSIDKVLVNSDHNDISLAECRMVAFEDVVTESDLIEAGYDPKIVQDLPTYGTDSDESDVARNSTGSDNESNHFSEGPNRSISIVECIFRIDQDGDGIAERRKIVLHGDAGACTAILENEIVTVCNYASGTPFIQTDRWLGKSLYDKLKEIQDQKTGFLRNSMDNAYHANNIRMGYVVGQANPDDVMNSKPGGTVRLKNPNALVPIKHTNILQNTLGMLGYLDKIRTERAGSSLDMNNENLPVGGETAHGAERIVSAKEQLASLIANTFAQTVVRDIYTIVHKVAREHITGDKQYKKADTWKSVNPSQWPIRNRIGIKVGMSQGERLQQSVALQGTMAKQAELMQQGMSGILVDASSIYKANIDFARLSGISNPEKYWVDPTSEKAMQAMQDQQKSSEQQKMEMQQQEQRMIQFQLALQQMQEDTKRTMAQMKAFVESAKLRQEDEQHQDNIAVDLTKLELEQDQEVPGALT